MKHTLYILLSFVVLSLTIACTADDDFSPAAKLFTVKGHVSGSDANAVQAGRHKVSVAQSANSLDLITRWQSDDRIQPFLLSGATEKLLGNVAIQNISADGKQCEFKLAIERQNMSNIQGSLVGFCGKEAKITADRDISVEANMIRSTIENFRAPLWFIAAVSKDADATINAQFNHFGAYELLHVMNTSDKEMQFRLYRYETALPWYYNQASYCPLIGEISNNGSNDTYSPIIKIPANATGTIVSWYLPTKYNMRDARIKAEVDGNIVYSVNTKSSDVSIVAGQAYHLYATWNGAELAFADGDIDEENLVLSDYSVEMKQDESTTVTIVSGSGDYSLAVSNSTIASATLGESNITIRGIAVGNITITVTDNKSKQTADIAVTVTKKDVNPSGPHEYVDLGLPSGTLWATCNVGANSPEEYGDYFAWGETTPKEVYDWTTYKWCEGAYYQLTKYCYDSSYGYNGFTDDKTELDLEDDAAYVNWGTGWRMPSKEQQDELREKCTWTWTTLNGVNGYEVVGPNGNSIFLPAAGHRDGECLYGDGSWGDYWSRALYSDGPGIAYELDFDSDIVRWDTGRSSYFGHSVRAVRR